jgi:hypothetical protein
MRFQSFWSEQEKANQVQHWRPSHPMEIIQRLVRNVAFATRESSGEEAIESVPFPLRTPLLSAFENAEQRSGDYPPIRE